MSFLAWVICAVATGALLPHTEVKFDELKKNPAKFNLQSVTVTGIVTVQGARIRLWRDVAMRQSEAWLQAIRVYPDMSAPRYPGTNYIGEIAANLRWVRVTGVVDTSFRGLSGDEPFGILLQRLEILPRPRLKQFLPVLAWFRNDTGAKIELVVTTKSRGTLASKRLLEPGDLELVEIERTKSRADVFLAGKRDSTRQVLLPQRAGKHYDAAKRACYFRIVKGAIQPVAPDKVGEWEFFPTPDRD